MTEWKTIPGYDDKYLVSDDGNVWSNYKHRLLKISTNENDGYCRVSFCYNVFLIHRIVAMTFLGAEEDKQVNHKDGDKTNNNVENLEWVTCSENASHREKLLKNSVIVDKEYVIKLHNDGYSYGKIAKIVGVSKGTISNIISTVREDSVTRKEFEIVDGETIRLIPGYDCYYASDSGRILSSKSGKELTGYENGCGYLRLNLYKDGKRKGFFIHRLVLSAFYGNSEYVVNHINGDKQDNRLCNLEYVTQSDNVKKCAKRKLSEQDKVEIKRLKALGYKREILGEMFGVTKCYINTICRE